MTHAANTIVIFLPLGQVAVYEHDDSPFVDAKENEDGTKTITLNHMASPVIYDTFEDWQKSLEPKKFSCGCVIKNPGTIKCVECGTVHCYEHGDWLDIDGEAVCTDDCSTETKL